jgi:prolyl 4-hydroxylase
MLFSREHHLATPEIFLNGIKCPSTDRISLSAGLPPLAPLAQWVSYRAREFMGALLEFTDDLGTPQIVRYEKGEKFDFHHDWYDSP